MLGNRPVPAPSPAALHDRALADLRFIRETMEQAAAPPFPSPPPAALHDRALADLRFIRETMEQASVTTFSGWALIGVGLLAVLVGTLASLARTRERWLLLLLVLPGVSWPLPALATARKSRAGGVAPASRPWRKVRLC